MFTNPHTGNYRIYGDYLVMANDESSHGVVSRFTINRDGTFTLAAVGSYPRDEAYRQARKLAELAEIDALLAPTDWL